MLIRNVVSFAALAGLLTILPGLDTALVLRWAIARGRREAFATALGVNTGVWIWGLAASVGVAAILTASHLAYTMMRLAGAMYMIWLGATLMWHAWLPKPSTMATEINRVAPGSASARAARAWARGVATNLLNPKIGVFYMAVLPQFIPEHSSHLAVGLLLATIHNVEGFVWFALLISGAQFVRRWVASVACQRAIDTLTGGVLLAFGATLALARR